MLQDFTSELLHAVYFPSGHVFVHRNIVLHWCQDQSFFQCRAATKVSGNAGLVGPIWSCRLVVCSGRAPINSTRTGKVSASHQIGRRFDKKKHATFFDLKIAPPLFLTKKEFHLEGTRCILRNGANLSSANIHHKPQVKKDLRFIQLQQNSSLTKDPIWTSHFLEGQWFKGTTFLLAKHFLLQIQHFNSQGIYFRPNKIKFPTGEKEWPSLSLFARCLEARWWISGCHFRLDLLAFRVVPSPICYPQPSSESAAKGKGVTAAPIALWTRLATSWKWRKKSHRKTSRKAPNTKNEALESSVWSIYRCCHCWWFIVLLYWLIKGARHDSCVLPAMPSFLIAGFQWGM